MLDQTLSVEAVFFSLVSIQSVLDVLIRFSTILLYVGSIPDMFLSIGKGYILVLKSPATMNMAFGLLLISSTRIFWISLRCFFCD